MELDVVQELQSYCSARGLPKPSIQDTLEYPYTYVTLISIGGKKAMSRGQSARSAREKAAFKWMKLYGQPEIRIFPPERNSPVSSPRSLDKSAGARAKSTETNQAKADNKLQVDATREDGTSEEEDPGELRDPVKKTLLKKVFGNSPITKRSPFKRSNKKSDRKKTSPTVSVDPDHGSSASDDDHSPPPPKKSA